MKTLSIAQLDSTGPSKLTLNSARIRRNEGGGMRSFRQIVIVLSGLLILPASVNAQQSTLSGVVKDSSSAVLPGVTIEASSPVLIEKTRTAVTDGTGQYRLPELPPGTYTVTFTLPGSSRSRPQGVQLTVHCVPTITT